MAAKLKTVVWDAADIKALSEFYQAMAGFTEAYADDDWVTLNSADGWRFGIQHAPDHVPPQWPDPAHPQQAHVDFQVADIDAAADRAVSLGARRLEGGGETWHVLADPAGHPFCLCRADTDSTKIFTVTIDTEDPGGLGRFYADLLGLEIQYEGEEGVMIGGEDAKPIMFQKVAEHQAPHWGDPAHPQQIHLDIEVDDIDAAEKEVLARGATRLGQGDNWRVFADPAGHPFDLLYTP